MIPRFTHKKCHKNYINKLIKRIKTITTPNKVGRPQKYKSEEERKDAKRVQDRVNQRECRRRKKIKKLKNEIERIVNTNKSIHRTISKKDNMEYRKSLLSFFGKFEYNTLFTGTLEPTMRQKNKIKEVKSDDSYQIQRHEYVSEIKVSQKMEMNLFIKKTKEYIDTLANMKLFERCFGVFELGKNNRIHVHIVFKKTEHIRNFSKLLKNHWKIGISHTTNKKKNEKDAKVEYCLKELKALSSKKRDMLMVDSWFFEGNFKSINN